MSETLARIDPPFVVTDLLKRCMGNVAFLKRTLTKFQTRGMLDVDGLQRAISDGNHAEATRLAHSIKGIAANLSASRMYAVAGEIENFGRADRIDAATGMIDSLRAEVSRCVAFVPVAIAQFSDPVAEVTCAR